MTGFVVYIVAILGLAIGEVHVEVGEGYYLDMETCLETAYAAQPLFIEDPRVVNASVVCVPVPGEAL